MNNWNFDMERESVSLGDFRPGDYGSATFKGRCKSCWGRLIGRVDDNNEVTGIKCIVCGIKLENNEAQCEYNRMQDEGLRNLMNMGWGHPAKYGTSLFVEKVFPRLGKFTNQELDQHVKGKSELGRKCNFLTRSDFPIGSPAYLFMQASLLVAGIEEISKPGERHIAAFIPDESMEKKKYDPRYLEHRLKRNMGTTMTEAMMSAFACELSIKAICLTRKDEAPKTHDLVKLYDFMPENSKRRITADYPNARSVLKRDRQKFGDWRYFETRIGKKAMLTMIDSERIRELGNVSRVLLDECEIVGLHYLVSGNVKEKLGKNDQKGAYDSKLEVNIVGKESPPRDDGD